MKKIVLIALVTLASESLMAQSPKSALEKISGRFAGEWTSYKYSANDEIVKSMTWKDTVVADKPVINDSLAFVNVQSVMTFANANIPPYKLDFREGFKVVNGKTSEHFITIMGMTLIENKVNDHTYIISQTVHPGELRQIGFTSAIEAYHTTVKVVLYINGKETHKITRISTVTWKEGTEIKTKQFISMEGFHQRI